MKKTPHHPLPKELLPKSAVGSDLALWEQRVQSLMAEASPILTEYRTVPIPWWSVMAERLRPHLAIAAAAAAVVMIAVHLSLPVPAAQSAPSLPLAAVIGEGNTAAALLSIANGEIDPVLALVILEGESP